MRFPNNFSLSHSPLMLCCSITATAHQRALCVICNTNSQTLSLKQLLVWKYFLVIWDWTAENIFVISHSNSQKMKRAVNSKRSLFEVDWSSHRPCHKRWTDAIAPDCTHLNPRFIPRHKRISSNTNSPHVIIDYNLGLIHKLQNAFSLIPRCTNVFYVMVIL